MKDDLRSRLLKSSTLDQVSILASSRLFSEKEIIKTSVPMINVALSGSVDGGMGPGLQMLAGPSKHFKTGFALLLIQAFQKKFPDGTILFYDSEFGTPKSYFETFGIDQTKILHCPITDIEQLKFDLVKLLTDDIKRGDEVMIVIDSVGNLASKKEVDDAMDGKSVADMSRAKQLKSLFRMITPHLTLKNVYGVVVNHTYKELAMYPKDIVSGGTGSYYSANDIWILGRQVDKEEKELKGHHFIINVEKSRNVKEKSRIPITVAYDGGINNWSGLWDVALEGKFIVSPSKGWYSLADRTTGEISEAKFRAADAAFDGVFWRKMFKETDFKTYIEKKYKMVTASILTEETFDEEGED